MCPLAPVATPLAAAAPVNAAEQMSNANSKELSFISEMENMFPEMFVEKKRNGFVE